MKNVIFKNQYLLLVFSILFVALTFVLIPRMGEDIIPQFKKSSMQILAFLQTPFSDEKRPEVPMEEMISLTGEIGCDKLLVKTINDENQKIETSKLLIIERGNYKYWITFVVESSNIRAIFYSKNGVTLNQKDEVMFMDNTRQRQAYRFIGKEKKSEKSIRHNMLQLDHSAVTWMASRPITTLYIKNNIENRMVKFSISNATQAKLQARLICLNKEFN